MCIGHMPSFTCQYVIRMKPVNMFHTKCFIAFIILLYTRKCSMLMCAVDSVTGNDDDFLCDVRCSVEKLWKEEVRRVGMENAFMSRVVFRFFWKRVIIIYFVVILYIGLDIFIIVSFCCCVVLICCFIATRV